MSNPLRSPEERARLRALCETATSGPWQWFGNTKNYKIYLATVDRGRVFVMDFVRWGMAGAQPRLRHPFGNGGGIMRPASESVRYEADHRKQFVGVDHPDAEFIAAARTALPDALALLDEVLAECDEARDWVRRLTNEQRTLTCVYCGHAYPPGSPTHGAEVLTAHIKVCPKHPMREADGRLKEAVRLLENQAACDPSEDCPACTEIRAFLASLTEKP